MSLSGKQWIWPDPYSEQALELSGEIECSPALARLLIKRGIEDPGQARAFLHPAKEQLYSPWLMQDMEEAVERLLQAISNSEKIIIHGDYDADGITASVIMVEALQQLGARVDYFLPSRFEEGYGLHKDSLQQFKAAGASLVVTVDCGINAEAEAVFASEIGLDMIITDHHQPLNPVSSALAVLNPQQKNCSYPYKELSGAGVAFKLASALMQKAGEPFPTHLLDLAALGTAADVVPLLDENRIIVSLGLDVLGSFKRLGFKALAGAVGLEPERVSSAALSFILAPAVNAAGRMGEALPAAKLLLEKDSQKAAQLADSLNQANQTRRATEKGILKEAEQQAREQLDTPGSRIITLAGKNWHHGVIGIVASRLVDKFNRPFVLVALEDGEGRGSARSIPGFDITAALTASSNVLERFGGHEQAAGFTVMEDNIELLRDNLASYASANLKEENLKSYLYLDAELSASEIEFDLVEGLEKLQPFGTANPRPLFGSRKWQVSSWRLVGSDRKHLKLKVQKDGRILDPIFFSGAGIEKELQQGRNVDLAFRLKNGSFRNQKTLDLEIKDIIYSDSVTCKGIEVIDMRGRPDRLEKAREIIKREGEKAVLFAATQSRAEKIISKVEREKVPCLLTSGSMNGSVDIPDNSGTLLLYDLPLHENILKKAFKSGLGKEAAKVYLLYHDQDQEQNCRLTEMALPSAENLEKIIALVLQLDYQKEQVVLPGLIEDKLDFKPAKSFWDRARKIYTEIGLLDQERFTKNIEEVMKNWPACLHLSPVYLEIVELLDNCEQFQRLLLDGPPQEIASYLSDL
ncbi:MAG: single-stranded-DNA-specific exonuclease RecJ [Bacillota bacterium]